MVFKRQKRRERGEKKMSSFGDGAVRAYQHCLLCFLSAVKQAANKSPIKDTLRQMCILQM
jgi:hypothetical protein